MSMKISRLAAVAAFWWPCAAVLAAADPIDTAPVHHAAHHRVRHRSHGLATAAPLRPQALPAAAAPQQAGPAPVPNEAISAPVTDPAPQTSAAPSVFQLHYPPQGDGYVTGSSPQAMDDRNAAKATGVEVKVPLPQ